MLKPHRLAALSLVIVASAACAPRLLPGACAPVAPGRQAIAVVAHRGWLAPMHVENSLREMQAAVHAGVRVLEIDLRASRDGTLYLLHDATLDRTTTGTGRIDAAMDVQLSGVMLKGADGTSTGEPLPRFDDVMAWADSEPGIELMLDIKGVDVQALVQTLIRRGLDSRCIILTFDEATTTTLLGMAHRAIVSVLVKTPGDIARYAALAHRHRLGLYVPQDAERSLYEAANATGLPTVSDAVMASRSGTLDERAAREGSQVYRDHLSTRAVWYFVSNYPTRVREAVCAF